MEEKEIINSAETSAMEPDTGAYIDAIKSIKENSVSTEVYNQMKKERDELLNSIVTGTASFKPDEEPAEEPVDIASLREDIFNGDNTNLQYVEKTLKLRNELIKRGERDPFLPWGKNINPTTDDMDKADKVAAILQDCVDIADGDSQIFTRELQRRTVETNIPRRR